jgi:dihydrofolate reductase
MFLRRLNCVVRPLARGLIGFEIFCKLIAMRKLIVSIHSSANDIVTGPSADETNFMVWAQAGIEDSHEWFPKSLANVDTILLGRATYEDLVRKWPKMKGSLADKINMTPKVVVTSKPPGEISAWGEFGTPTRFTGNNIEQQIRELKERDGGDIITFGSPTLVQSLANARLVDEYRILIHPVIVNEGKRLFEHLDSRTNFRLINVEKFEHGSMLVTYAPLET